MITVWTLAEAIQMALDALEGKPDAPDRHVAAKRLRDSWERQAVNWQAADKPEETT